MDLIGRIGNKYEPCHPWFHHDEFSRIQAHDHSLTDPTYVMNRPPYNAPPKMIDARHNCNRFPRARHTLHILNARTDDS
jgi:hypothetical protein